MDVRLILYVEDDDATSNLVRLILEQEAPHVELLRARDHREAMAILMRQADHSPDLILLDLNLPQKNGLEILTDLKKSESFGSIPVVMFSTSTAVADKVRALDAGAHAYITKPSSFELFVNAVRKACQLPDPEREGPKKRPDSGDSNGILGNDAKSQPK